MLEKNDELVSEIPVGTEGIPNLQRGPGQLENATASLRRSLMEDDYSGRSEANMFMVTDEGVGGGDGDRAGKKDFLASRGQRLLGQFNFDAEKLERDLHQIVPRASAQGQEEEVFDHHIQVFASSIHEALVTTMSTSEHKSLCLMEDEWEEEKRQIMADLRRSDSNKFDTDVSIVRPEVRASVGSTAFSSTQDIAPSDYLYDGSDRTEVYQYLDKLRRGDGDLAREFRELPREPWCQSTWDLVGQITQQEATKEGWLKGSLQFLEQQYYAHKVRSGHEGGADPSVRKVIKSWLERVREKPLLGAGGLGAALAQGSEMQSSSAPSSLSGVGGHWGASKPTMHGLPPWAVVYYCLRVGSWDEAAAEAAELKKQSKLDDFEVAMADALQTLASAPEQAAQKLEDLAALIGGDDEGGDGLGEGKGSSNGAGSSSNGGSGVAGSGANSSSTSGTSKSSNGNSSGPFSLVMRSSAGSSVRGGSSSGAGSGDAAQLQHSSSWKRAVLYILLAGKPSDRLLDRVVNATVQDFMWLKLSVLRVLQATRKVSLQERALASLQNTLERNGAAHFAGGNDFQLYARLLIMAQNPLAAIDFLAKRSTSGSQGGARTSLNDAVHIALALQQRGILAGPPRPSEDRTDAEIEAEADALLGKLIMEYTKPRFVRDQPGDALLYFSRAFRAQSSTSCTAVADGIAYIFLVHVNRLDEVRKLISPELDQLTRSALLRAGRMAEDQGRLSEAVQLYLESGAAQDRALAIFNRQLVQCIRPPHRDREELLMRADRLLRDRIDTSLAMQDSAAGAANRTFKILLNFLHFTEDIDNQRWERALQRVEPVLPTSPDKVERCKKEYATLDEAVLDVFTQIFHQALEALQRLAGTQPDRAPQIRRQFEAYQSFFNAIPESAPHIAHLIATFQLR
ncbi:Nuclear pore complex protein Nup93 [Hondaea fermentalgiana]|uniref:Nuclear pore protein n=1 Tax=Hondaea fermentalgiana TaxID=2315210 RepID=A0A2R5GJE0_9STRA|nr:Nuclear pore complex protein Nup93 [Hondaea fermentalgiana]|eukprot:GBG30997.1 Nuclear pore complex protein Nup93 [Hondaea fermentalgiana]